MKTDEITSKEYREKYNNKKQKYGNHKVEYQGMKFDSQKELNRWKELRFLEGLRQIKDLQRQIKYELQPKLPGQRAVNYIADFQYLEIDGKYSSPEHNCWKVIVEDCKGYKTPIYKLKSKLMKAKFGIDIYES